MRKENAKKVFGVTVIIALLLSIGAGVSSSAMMKQTIQDTNPTEPLPTYTHTVLGEEASATWCQFCPEVIQALETIYNTGLYDFEYVALVGDMNSYAQTRINELGVSGYPTVKYDGGYQQVVGGGGGTSPHIAAINSCGARAVANIDLTLTVTWQGSAQVYTDLGVTNNAGTAYNGRVRVYVTEINSRWWNRGVQYKFAMVGNYAINQVISVGAGATSHYINTWNGNSYGVGDIDADNIMVVAAVFQTGTNYVDETIAKRINDTFRPEWRNQGENVSSILKGGSVKLYAQAIDGFGLNKAILQTNESGSWQNITGKYGSPMNLGGVGGQWVWTNFTWQNQAIPQGRRIGWRIFYNDTSGNWNRTNIMSFDILQNPVLIDHTPQFGYTGDTFTFNASITDDQGIAAAYVEYWYGTGGHTNLTMVHTNGNYYERTITIQSNALDTLHYIISAKDPLNYWSSTGEKLIPIYDNDNPFWRNQGESATIVSPGESVTLYAQGKDNIGVQRAVLATNETGIWLTYSGLPWWHLGWNYCKTLLLNHSRVSTDLTNFPVLISIISSDFIGHTQADGDDFVFVDETNTTKLNHEIEYYNSVTGELVAWVNVPLLSATSDTIINLYYGNESCENQQNVAGTWNFGYIMVHHMTGATYTDLKDSTGNHWDITSQGGDPTYNQPGKMAKSVDFDPSGTWDYLKAGLFRLPSDSTYTGSAWVYVDGSFSSRRYLFEGDSGDGISLLVWTDGRFKAAAGTDTSYAYCYSTTTVSGQPQWQYVCTRVDTSTDLLSLFVNGVNENSSTIVGVVKPETEGLNIATSMNNNQYYMNGRMDEIRISNVARSDSWIQTEYNMMAEPYLFTHVCDEVIHDGGSKYGSPLDLTGAPDQWVWSNFTWQNPLIPTGRTIGWRIYYSDASKNEVSTDVMSFMVGEQLPSVLIDGECFYQGMIPANTVTVEITNTLTGQRWQAATNNNHYSLSLIIGQQINAGDNLQFIAWDDNESVNVTTHVVTPAEITAGALHQDLILAVHYRDLKEFPYYAPQVDTGAAVMKMMLDYLMWNSSTHPNGPPSVYNEQTLYTTYKGPDSTINGSELCGGLNSEIDDYHHGWIYGYFFAPYADTTANNVLKTICIWLDYPVNYYNDIRDVDVPKPGHPNHVPIAVPLYGNYNNWAVVRGIHTDRNAWLPPGQLTVYGFWVNGYLPGGIGENTYVTSSRFLSSYFQPLNVVGDSFNGKYLAITDPSRDHTIDTNSVQVTLTDQSAGFTLQESRIISQYNRGATKGIIDAKMIRTAFNEAMKVLQYDPIAETFAGSHVLGKPQYDKITCSVVFVNQITQFTVMLNKQTGVLLEIHIENDATTE